MTQAERLSMLEDLLKLEAGALSPELALDQLAAWDSVAVLAFIVLLDERSNQLVEASRVVDCRLVADLLEVMGEVGV